MLLPNTAKFHQNLSNSFGVIYEPGDREIKNKIK